MSSYMALHECEPKTQPCEDDRFQQPAGRTRVLAVQTIRATVEGLQRRVGGVPAAASANVHRSGERDVKGAPSGLSQTPAEIRILPVQEEALVQSLNSIERRPPYKHACARHPVHLGRFRCVTVARGEIPSRQRIIGQDSRQPRAPTRDEGCQVRESARRWLHRTVGVPDARTRDSYVRSAVDCRDQLLAHRGGNDAIGVYQEQQRRAGGPRRQIHAGSEAGVGGPRDQFDPREPRDQT